MTVVVLIGFFLMLLTPCVIAILGGRERKQRREAVPVSAVSTAAGPVDKELDLPVREPGDMRHLEPVAAGTPAVEKIATVALPAPRAMLTREEPQAFGVPQRVQRRSPDLKSIVAQAEGEALVAHAMAAQANAAALAATARAAQARAQAAAEHAVEANRAAANHAAAVREREARLEEDESAAVEQPTWPELTVVAAADGDSQRAA